MCIEGKEIYIIFYFRKNIVFVERDTFLLNDKPLVNKTQTFKKGENMIIKCQVSDDTVYSMELSHDSGQKLVTLITKVGPYFEILLEYRILFK